MIHFLQINGKKEFSIPKIPDSELKITLDKLYIKD